MLCSSESCFFFLAKLGYFLTKKLGIFWNFFVFLVQIQLILLIVCYISPKFRHEKNGKKNTGSESCFFVNCCYRAKVPIIH
jgi:hypothetical protein